MKIFKLLVIFTIICFSLNGCVDDPYPIAGTYHGNYAGGLEVIVLNEDGTYSQNFTKNGKEIYSSSGEWRLGPSGKLKFTDFMFLIKDFPKLSDFTAGKNINPIKIQGMTCTITNSRRSILINEDYGYMLSRKIQ